MRGPQAQTPLHLSRQLWGAWDTVWGFKTIDERGAGGPRTEESMAAGGEGRGGWDRSGAGNEAWRSRE